MLLNQCLALSLSFRSHNESPSSSTSSSFSPSSSSPSSSSSSTSSQLSRDDNENELQHRQANIGTKSCSNQINQSTALNLFDQLVLENSNLSSSSASSRSQGGRKSDNLKILAQVFKRVEFAGFVVPSWLLLSGTYDDLHCIKSNWATGQLRAPKGLRIETIGNIRSMNVDYFGEPPRKPPSVGTEMMIEHSKNAATTTSLSENRQQQQLTASTTSTRRQRPTSEMEPNAGAELEARVLCSLRWLASARLMDKVGLEQLTAFIGNKWPQQKELATLDSIERTTRALTQQGRLQMGRFEGALETRPGVQEETSTGQGWFVQLPHCSTVMATATMISTSIQEPNTTTSPSATISGRNSASSTRSAKSKSTTLDSGLGGGCSSSGTGGGGSSGCDVDDSGSPMNERDATAVAQASLVDDEFQPSAQLAVVEKAPQSGSSILSRLRVARSTSRRRHRVDDGLEEFSSGGCEAASRTFASELPAPRQVLVADEGSGRGGETETPRLPDSTSRQRRRGFSLTRSLSFRPAQKASQQQQQQQQSASNKDTSQASAAATVQLGVGAQLDYGEHHLQNQNTPSKQTTTTASHQQPTTTTNRLNANLSSLFRSKSMRVVSSSSSSGRARAVENAANLDCDNDDDDDELNDDDYADDDYNVGNADHYHHHRQQQQQQQQHRRRRRRWRRRDDISRASPRDTSARLRRDTSVACRGQHEATIDYLTQASTQRHSASQHLKRTFSMRRNSILAFGKDELGGGAGRIAMFLRRLFNIGRATAAATGGAARNRQRADACVATALVDSSEHCFAESTDQQQRGQLDTTTQQPPPPPTQPAHRGCSVHHLVDIHHHHHSSTTTAAHTKQWWPLENGSTEECACKQTVGDLNNNNNNDHHKNHRHEDDAPHHQHQHCHQDNADAEARLLEDVDQRRRRARPRRHNRDEFAPAAADEEEEVVSLSPSQNSLIEILDCSRSIEESKRDLRQVPARSSDTTSHRATWKLIKRSESSLSQRSNTSCSTNKSTVSQQLRRHLDEAYKRHRNCTSKRERDFIDSINVLRQASRHASLENSRSSSKNRRHRSHHQHNPTGSATANGANQQQQQHANLKSSSSQTTTTSPSSAVSASSSSSSARRRRSANDSSDVDDSTNSSRLDSFTSPLESTTTVSSSSGAGEPRGPQDLSKVSIEDDEDFFIRSATAKLVAAANLQQWPVQLTKLPVTEAELNDDVIGSPEPVACDCCCPMVVTSSSSSATMAIPPNQQQQLQPSGMMIDARQAQSASLCDGQFNCCQALVDHHHHHQQAALAALAQSLPACCLTLQPLTTQPNFGSQLEPLLPAANHLNHHHHHHHNNSNNNQPKQQQLNQLALQTNNVETGGGGSSLCCPIWRSMIYSYCQQQQASAAAGALPFNVIASAAIAAAANGAADGQSPPGNILPGAGFPTGGFNLCEMPGQGIIGQHQNHIHHQQQQQPSSSQPLDGGDSISRPSLSSSFSTTQLSTNQQQQHNTTIDLKIEIGADFKKLAAKSLARRRDYHGLAPRSISARLKQTARAASAAANQPSSSSSDDNTTTDSLDNQLDSRHLSEEAYSEQSTSVTDESLPTEPFESLRSGAWRQTVTESAKSKTKGSSNNNTRKEFQTKARDLTTSCDDAEDDDEAGQAGQDDHSMPSALGQEQQLDSARRRRDVLTH